jgi:hypothetical protein
VLGLFLPYYLCHRRRRRHHHHHHHPARRTITTLRRNVYTHVYSFTFHFRCTFVQH